MRRVKKKKGIKAHRAKPPNPTREIYVPIGNEEQKKEENERNGEQTPNPATLDLWSPLKTCMDHMVGLF